MAPVATTERDSTPNGPVKPAVADKVFNPFYSPPDTDNGDETYKYADFKVRWPVSMHSSKLKFLLAVVPKYCIRAPQGAGSL